jgi:hypothetical protein
MHSTFKAACNALGLLQNDREQEMSLQDAAISQTGYQLRLLFVHILANCSPKDPARLWTIVRNVLSDDLHPRTPDAASLEQRHEFADQRANADLIHLNALLRNLEKESQRLSR